MRKLILGLLIVGLSGCGFKQVYQAQSIEEIGAVRVNRIANRSGQILRNNLQQALAMAPRKEARYYLSVGLSESRRSGGVRLAGDLATRGTFTMTASFNLREIKSGKTLYGGRYQTFGSYDIVGNAYENTAAVAHTRKILLKDVSLNIVSRISLFFQQGAFENEDAVEVDEVSKQPEDYYEADRIDNPTYEDEIRRNIEADY